MDFYLEEALPVDPRKIERCDSPIVKGWDLAYLRFGKPDLNKQADFFRDFGFVIADQTSDRLYVRGAGLSPYFIVVEKAPKAEFLGLGVDVRSREELAALATNDRVSIDSVDGPGGGERARLTDPNGFTIDAVYNRAQEQERAVRKAAEHNTPENKVRINQGQRGPIAPPDVVRLGHVVLLTPDFTGSMQWYKSRFGLIPTDVLCLKDGTPALAFNRFDRGNTPADHHSIVLTTYPVKGYDHSAYEVHDIDAVGLGQQMMKQKGHKHEWGIGRHILGSQLFDYWSDQDGFKFEHFADGDVFTSDYETGYHPLSSQGLYQWGADFPPAFTKPKLSIGFILELVRNLRTVPDFTFKKLQMMLSSTNSKARPWL